MAVPTSAQVGQKVTVITDLPVSTPAPTVTSAQVGEIVKYVPTPGAADDN
jgi:hypothetical protein